MIKCDLCNEEGIDCRFCNAIRCNKHIFAEPCPNNNYKGDKK